MLYKSKTATLQTISKEKKKKTFQNVRAKSRCPWQFGEI